MRLLKLTLLLASTWLPVLAKDPLPAQVMTAKTVYIKNDGGSPEFAERAYRELTKWGRFEVVTDWAKADLIFDITCGKQPFNPSSALTVAASGFVVFDPRTGAILWSDRKRSLGFRVVPLSQSVVKRAIDDLRKRIEEQ